jgi:hypothetical protein
VEQALLVHQGQQVLVVLVELVYQVPRVHQAQVVPQGYQVIHQTQQLQQWQLRQLMVLQEIYLQELLRVLKLSHNLTFQQVDVLW